MSDGWQGDERRGHPRIAVGGDVQGKIETSVEAPLVDLSLSGALLEVASALPAQSRYLLRLPLDGNTSLEIQAEVVRSYVHGFDKDDSGQPAVKYRAALKFVDVTDAQERGLRKFLEGGKPDPIRAELSS